MGHRVLITEDSDYHAENQSTIPHYLSPADSQSIK